MDDELRHRWNHLLQAWSVDQALAARAFGEVCKSYGELGRYYHILDHIRQMLNCVDSIGSHACNLNAVRLATWLHDVIYDSRASDNEERSADYARRLCQNLSIPDGDQVALLILKTKSHEAGDDPDAQVLLDADLSILGASEPAYRIYAEKIRQEYAWVPEPEYRSGRRQVLTKFLMRPRIFHFLTHLEEPARHNITAEIAPLAVD
jgi:predicted metal-dependent HD superfamily phosphohydrolase